MKKFYETIIVGAGVSGMITAITIAKNNHQVLLLEKNERVGKKILSTGNGRCNFFNDDFNEIHFNNSLLIKNSLTKVSKNDILNFFNDLGIDYMIEDGRYYPNSQKASSILDILRFNLDKYKVDVKTSSNVLNINHINDQYEVFTNDDSFKCKNLVLSCGSKASITDKYNGIDLLNNIGLKCTNLHPGLVGLKVNDNLNAITGIRLNVSVSLYENSKLLYKESGELQIKKDGFSGIPILNCSNRLTKNNTLVINFLPQFDSSDSISGLIISRLMNLNNYKISETLCSLLPKQLTEYLLKRINVDNNIEYKEIKFDDIKKLSNIISNCEFEIVGPYGYDNAHITCGGVMLNQLNEYFESLNNNNLYVVGELLDINGDCGGYNIGFAALSGIICGKKISNVIDK